MFTDERVFANDYLPRDLPHRNSEADELSTAFEPALAGLGADHVLLSSPSGVGKTALARHTLRKLDASDRGHVAHGYVRCLGATTAGILRAALSQYPRATDPPRNTPTADLRHGLAAAADDSYILVLNGGDDLNL